MRAGLYRRQRAKELMPSNCDAGEDSWESLGQQRDQTNLKGNPPWMLVGRTDAEVETPVVCSFDMNSWLIGKVPDAGKDWRQEEKGVSEDEMAGWYHQCNGHELGQTLMVRDREAWRAAVHRVTKNWTQLGSWTTTWQEIVEERWRKGKKKRKKYHEFLSNLKKNCGKVSLMKWALYI